MKILIFTQHFPPETVATGRRAFDLAESLSERGHRVTVITGVPNHPSSLGRSYCRVAPRAESAPAGYRIIRVRVFRSTDTQALKRFLTYATFVLSAALAGLRQERPDVILAVSPLPTGLAALPVHWLRHSPLVFDLQDVWPDSAMAVGVMRPGLVLRSLRRLERFFYSHCQLIVGISKGFKQYLVGLGVRPERVAVIPNGVDIEMFSGINGNREFQRSHHLEGKFVVGYTGNLGLAQGLDTLLDAAAVLRGAPIRFLLVGEGTDKLRIMQCAAQRRLQNVEFVGGVSREHIPSILALCDALLLILRRDPLFKITIPSKLYEYMVAGKPILCSVGGEAAGLVAACRCGLPIAPSDTAALVEALQHLMRNHALCRNLGEMGIDSAQKYFSRRLLMAHYAELMERLVRTVPEPVGRLALSLKK